jgi:hypothetical protein
MNGSPPTGEGALLAVCGLCARAGASTLAYLVARHCGRDPRRPVLVSDTGGPDAELAVYAGVESPRSLTGVADAVAGGESLEDGVFAEDGDGLRVVARRPEPERAGDEQALQRVLRDAREAHLLTVVDCGTLTRPADWWVLAAATHVAWVVPATEGALSEGERMLATLAPLAGRPELIVARREPSERRPPTSTLKQLATERAAPLVLMPHVPSIIDRPPVEALEEASVTLAVIEGALWR